MLPSTISALGASKQEWETWTYLAQDHLLPAVADDSIPAASAYIDNNGKTKQTSLARLDTRTKTPGVVRRGTVSGFTKWVDYVTTADEVRGWANSPYPYNICLRLGGTGGRPIAIDVDMDGPHTAAFVQMIRTGLQQPVIERSREGSSHITFVFRLAEELPIENRNIKFGYAHPGDHIELLGIGHHSVVAGTNQNGARWVCKFPDPNNPSIPVVPFNVAQALWEGLREMASAGRNAHEYPGKDDESEGRNKPFYDPDDSKRREEKRQAREHNKLLGRPEGNDPLVEWAYENNLVLGVDGHKILMKCPHGTEGPWGPGHSTNREGGDSSSAWLERGSNGYANGAWVCLHENCDLHAKDTSGEEAMRVTALFTRLVGYDRDQHSKTFGVGLPIDPRINLGKAPSVDGPASFAPDTGPFIAMVKPMPANKAATYLPVVRNNTFPTVADESVTWQQSQLVAQRNAGLAEALLQNTHGIERKNGIAKKSLKHLRMALSMNPQIMHFRYDEFTQATQLRYGAGEWEAITEEAYSTVHEIAEQVLGYTPERSQVIATIHGIAKANKYDSAIAAANSLIWDGIPRIETFDTDVLKVHKSEYTQALGKYLWLALAARVLEPGVQCHIAPLFISPKQGTGKSSLVRYMALKPGWSTTLDLAADTDDNFRKMQGMVLAELDEMKGMSSKAVEHTKSFIASAVDTWVPKYSNLPVAVPRRCLFIGTSNTLRLLQDATGNRRWAPLQVAVTAPQMAFQQMEALAPQYWAEAVHLLRSSALSISDTIGKLSIELEELAKPAVLDATVEDSWQPLIHATLLKLPQRGYVTGAALMEKTLGIKPSQFDVYKASRLRDVMTMLRQEVVDGNTWRVSPLAPLPYADTPAPVGPTDEELAAAMPPPSMNGVPITPGVATPPVRKSPASYVGEPADPRPFMRRRPETAFHMPPPFMQPPFMQPPFMQPRAPVYWNSPHMQGF